MMGPATGPMKVAAEKTPRAKPLSTGPQKSANVPPTTAKGEDPKNPPKNLANMIVSTFDATATGIWKIAAAIKPMKTGTRRPYLNELIKSDHLVEMLSTTYSSETGPHTIGPPANPRTYRLVPSTMTSSDTWNLAAVTTVAVLKTLLEKVKQKVMAE